MLEPARDELLAMFSRALSFGLAHPQHGILAISRYHDEKQVWSFVEAEHSRVMT